MNFKRDSLISSIHDKNSLTVDILNLKLLEHLQWNFFLFNLAAYKNIFQKTSEVIVYEGYFVTADCIPVIFCK